jgi:NOL1/NOP2/fmu family ribosome biogenesis protein
MRIIVYDIEVFRYDWIAVFYDITLNQWFVFHNDNAGISEFILQPGVIFCGFNIKHYDNPIIKAIACGADNALVKEINDFIIVEGRQGWEHHFIRKNRFFFDSFDLMDDTQLGTSLKHIEAHLFMDIEETQVDFNTDRPLTTEEIESTIFYCKHDVKATAKFLTLRKNYLECKINLGALCSTPLPPNKALYYTNARLAAKYLDATYVQRYDGREYEYPPNLNLDLIPKEILDFFKDISWEMDWSRLEIYSEKVYYMPEGVPNVKGIRFLRTGLYLGDLKKNRFEPSQSLAMSLNKDDFSNVINLTAADERVNKYLKGETIDVDDMDTKNGWVLICVDSYPLGWGKLNNGAVKNKYLPGWRLMS